MQYFSKAGRRIFAQNLEIREDTNGDSDAGSDSAGSEASGEPTSCFKEPDNPIEEDGTSDDDDISNSTATNNDGRTEGNFDREEEISDGRGEESVFEETRLLRKQKNVTDLRRQIYNSKGKVITRISEIIANSWVSSISDIDCLIAENEDVANFQFHPKYNDICGIVLKQQKVLWLKNTFQNMIEHAFDQQHSVSFKDCADVDTSYQCILNILQFNYIDLFMFYNNLIMVMNCQRSKINSIFFKGPPNAGKTMLALSIARACKYFCNIQDFNKTSSNFLWEPALHNRCILINEPMCDDSKIEIFKNIVEGQNVSIDVKYKSMQTLNRTPVILTGNYSLAAYTQHKAQNDAALMTRMFVYNLGTNNSLADFPNQIHPGAWFLFHKYILSTIEYE